VIITLSIKTSINSIRNKPLLIKAIQTVTLVLPRALPKLFNICIVASECNIICRNVERDIVTMVSFLESTVLMRIHLEDVIGTIAATDTRKNEVVVSGGHI